MRVPTPSGEIHVEVAGPDAAPVLLLLHAFPLHAGMWSAQIDALRATRRIVAPDFRGFGRSDPGDGQYALDFFVDDVFAALDAAGAGRRVAACGCSMGGYVLLRAVEREPGRFGALMLVDTKASADDNEAKLKRFDAVRALRDEGAEAYAESFADGALGRTTKARRAEVVERVKAMVRSHPVRGMVGAQLAMAARTDTTHVLSSLSIPTVVVTGEEDALIPPDVAEEMARRIPGARFEVLPGVGHLPPLEAPEAFNRALLAL